MLDVVELSAAGEPSRRRLLARDAPAARHRRRPAAPPAAVDPRRARDGPRPGRDARHAPADPRLAGDGITVLLSSHQLPEVQELCDRVAIVDRGRVVYEGALADLRRQGGAGYRLRTHRRRRALEIARSQPGIEHAARRRARHRLPGRRAAMSAQLSLALAQAGIGHPLADTGPCDARGPVLPPHRDAGRRTGRPAPHGRARRATAKELVGAAVSARRRLAPALPAAPRHSPPATVDAHRLPLGAAQAGRPEADIPGPRAGRRAAAVLRRLPDHPRHHHGGGTDSYFAAQITQSGLATPC